MKPRGRLNRRGFLQGGAIAAIGALLPDTSAHAAAAADEAPRIRRKAVLGTTGLRIADVSFGSSRLRGDEELVRYALDRGINYFDTAESYTGGVSEETIGRALAGKRDRVVLASKTHAGARTRKKDMFRALEGSLRRLRTDVIDVYFNHAVNDVDRMQNPEWHEFVERAKTQGKIRFSGMSGHAGRLIPVLDWVIDNRAVDVVLVAYNFGQDPAFYQRFLDGFDFVALQPELPRVLAKAKTAGIGVVAMKTLMGGRLNDLRPYEKGGATFAQAAFRWVLSSSDVDALIVSMTSRAEIDEYLGASGWQTARSGDLPLLYRYARRHGDSYCRFGCDLCHAACPDGVPVSEVLRTRMYERDYGDALLARESYAALGEPALACLGCAQRSCTDACPHGLQVGEETVATHRALGRS